MSGMLQNAANEFSECAHMGVFCGHNQEVPTKCRGWHLSDFDFWDYCSCNYRGLKKPHPDHDDPEAHAAAWEADVIPVRVEEVLFVVEAPLNESKHWARLITPSRKDANEFAKRYSKVNRVTSRVRQLKGKEDRDNAEFQMYKIEDWESDAVIEDQYCY